ncbi:glycosyltransferase, partial [Turicibacter sanguinis]|nr:glycosyltransferase [Turicibacter sanguinis]
TFTCNTIHYCIAGEGELEIYLKEKAKYLGVEKQVHLLGFRSDILELYKISDIFCFPSYREGLSVSLMEAMSSGLPIICSNIRGNIDLVDVKGGYLCEPDSIKNFEQSICKLIMDEEKRRKMTEYNKYKIKLFDKDLINDKMINYYMLSSL